MFVYVSEVFGVDEVSEGWEEEESIISEVD